MIAVSNISKSFKLYRNPADRLKEVLLRRPLHRKYTALDAVSFQVRAGETLGIIGENGSGKSTLLKILTGVLLPDAGSFCIDGKITGILELGTGFNPEFTGLQNIYLNGMYLGLSKREIEARVDDIIAFCELGDFIREPIKTYSSGMLMRLAFSIAIHADPQCFVVDEALAVGDAYFQQKCMQKLKKFRQSGGAIVFVSHDLNAVKILCDRALLLDHGLILKAGDPEDIINTYNFILAKKHAGEPVQLSEKDRAQSAYGNNKARIDEVAIYNSHGQETQVLVAGERCRMEVVLHAEEAIADLTLGFAIRDRFGQDIFATNTFHLNRSIEIGAGESRTYQFVFDEFNIGPGKYTLTLALHSGDIHVHDCYHWADKIAQFEVVHGGSFFFQGLVRIPTRVEIVEDGIYRISNSSV